MGTVMLLSTAAIRSGPPVFSAIGRNDCSSPASEASSLARCTWRVRWGIQTPKDTLIESPWLTKLGARTSHVGGSRVSHQDGIFPNGAIHGPRPLVHHRGLTSQKRVS